MGNPTPAAQSLVNENGQSERYLPVSLIYAAMIYNIAESRGGPF